MGLYSPTEGRILFDGLDLKELELRSVRRQVGVMPQHPRLRALTNYRVLPDGDAPAGYRLDTAPFPGWESLPTW